MSATSASKRYVSLGFHELDLLSELNWGERAMYLELKRLANFKTGKVGVFRSQKLTWEELGRLVSVPSSQGRAAKSIDGKEAALMMGRLEALGLVADQGRRENGGIVMTLPLSPIEKATMAKVIPMPEKEIAQRAAAPEIPAVHTISDGWEDAEPIEERMPNEWEDEIPETPGSACVPEVKASRMSVMMLSEHINTFFNTESGAGDTPAPCPPPAAIPTPNLVENLPNAAGAPLTLAGIRSRLAAAGFLYLFTRDSQSVMEGWMARGVPQERLEKGISEISNDPGKQPTPAALDRCLRVTERARNGRGRVAL